MRVLSKIIIAARALLYADIASSTDFHIGLVTPQNGPLEVLGRQMRDGAKLATANKNSILTEISDECATENGVTVARALIDANVKIAVGFLCTETLESALPILSQAGIPVVTPAVRTDRITDNHQRNHWPVWRTAPRADAEAKAISEILLPLWRTEFMAIVDDGTIYGRDLAEKFRLNAELAGLRPVFIDSFRAEADNQIGLVGRLRRAGATHVFVGGERDDVARISRDAASLGYDLVVAGGEALRATGEIALSAGTLMVALPEWQESRTNTSSQSVFSQNGLSAEGYVAQTYATMEIALQALEASRTSSDQLVGILASTTFQTILGPMSFNSNGDLVQNQFRLLQYDGEKFILAE